MKNNLRRYNRHDLRRKKRPHQKAVRTTISMPPALWDIAAKGMKTRSCSTLSGFFQTLIRDHQNQVRHQMELPLWSARGSNADNH
jgi:hypothetical protein